VTLDTSIVLDRTQPDAVVYRASDDVSAGTQVYVTSAQQAENPEAADQLRRFLAAVERAMEFIVADAEGGFGETMRIIGEKFEVSALDDPDVARETLQAYVDSFTADGTQNLVFASPDRWRATYDELVEIGLIRPGLDPVGWLDPRFAPTAA
jgi:NitT/TauT family transport system substrate-binding protein